MCYGCVKEDGNFVTVAPFIKSQISKILLNYYTFL